MKDPTELSVGVSSARFELDGGGRCQLLVIVGIQFGSTELEPVDKEPDSVPLHWLDVPALQEFAEFLDCIGSAWDPEYPDFRSRVERCESVFPSPLQSWTHRHRVCVSGHNRDDTARGRALAQLVDERFWAFEVPEHAVAQHCVELPTRDCLDGPLTVGLEKVDPLLSLGR